MLFNLDFAMMLLHPTNFKKLLISLFILLCLGAYLTSIKFMSKDSFTKISGRITYLENHYHQYPLRDFGKFRYIALDTYPYIIELFVGKDAGDFSPEYENLGGLKTGDEITIYYDDDSDISKENINRTTEYIYKVNICYFHNGNNSFYVGIFILIMTCLGFIFLLYQKKKGKI